MASPNISEIVTTTIRNRSRKLADNVTNNTALLKRLQARGNIRPADGGTTILEEVEYAENKTYKRYSGFEILDISPSDIFSAAEFAWKQAAVAVIISGLEEAQNSGRERMINLIEGRVRNAEKTMINNISVDIYSDGTADGGKQIGGMQLLVSDAGTGTVGGIDSSTFTFWQNQLTDLSVESLDPATTPADMQLAMDDLWLKCKRNADEIDLVVQDNVHFKFYWNSLQQIQRFGSPAVGEIGFHSLKFMNADVVPDGGQGGSCPASHTYMLNTDYIFFRPHSDRNMQPLNPDRYSTNQDAVVKLIGFTGNMTVANRSLQGVIIA